ncbi:MAG: phospholipase D-like domain-containing protein [Bacteroidota bacterium]
MINGAAETIHLQTYIYDGDETGQLVAGALKAAVKRNVQVYMLIDGYASKALSKEFIKELQDAGIHFRFFNPLLKSKHFYFGRRLHHKVVVTDTKYALVGGVNISNKYNDMPGQPAWLDFAIYIEGEAARELCVLCWKTWKNYPATINTTPCEQKKIQFAIPAAETCDISMRQNDWVRRKNEISGTYIDMLRHAKSHITILCSYFLPGKVIRRQLRNASKRGVKITVITAGASDIILSKYAERFMYDWLLRYDIELYEYQPTVLHGKIAVCDGQWMTIGSYNINDISAYASIELNMNVQNEKFASAAEKVLTDIIEKDCVHVTSEYYAKTKNIFKQFAHWLSYQFIRFMLFLFTFYFKHEK